MSSPFRFNRSLAKRLIGASLSISLCGCGASDEDAAVTEAAATQAANSERNDEDLSGLIGADADPSVALAKLTWDNMDQFASQISEEPALQQRFQKTAADSQQPASRFLAALLLLAQGDEVETLNLFRTLPMDEVPPNHLYAAYRLHQRLDHDRPNLFRAHLRQAISKGELVPLSAARFLAHEGEVEASLKQYLKADPAHWVLHDVDNFRIMCLHAGLATEVKRLVEAALRAGRVPDTVVARIQSALVTDKATYENLLQSQFQDQVRNSPEVRKLVAKAALRQLEVRKQFVERRYADLLRKFSDQQPTSLPDETVLLLTLSAAQQKNTTALDLWSGELRRRNPHPEVEAWVRTLSTTKG